MASASQSVSTAPTQSPTTKQEAFLTKWLPQAEAHYNVMLTRSSEELWSTLATNDVKRAFHIYDICYSQYDKHREEFTSELKTLPNDRKLDIFKTFRKFCVQVEKLREATNVSILVWDAYKNGDMGHEKRKWFRMLPEAFRKSVETWTTKLGEEAKDDHWS